MRRDLLGLALAATLPLAVPAQGDDPKPNPAAARGKPGAWTTAVANPKPLGDPVKKGLEWLVRHQHEDGGWAQGEESEQMRAGNQPFSDRSNVADTCIAALALIRSGSTPTEGPYRDAIARAVRFVRGKVEASDKDSLSVTDVNGTRVQMKLGPNIDTFLASMLLSEVKGRMPESDENTVDLALQKVIDKIQKHQKADGSFEGGGWAPVLAQAMNGKGLNRARQAGAFVPERALAQAEQGARNAVGQPAAFAAAAPAAPTAPTEVALATSSPTAGPAPAIGDSFSSGAATRSELGRADGPVGTGRVSSYAFSRRGGVGGGAAGVELYDKAASLGVLSDSVNTKKARKAELQDALRAADKPAEARKARDELSKIEETEKVREDAQKAVVARLDDKAFIAGFGSNGGEEFLSYMNIGESLVVKGGHDWETWDRSMADNLTRVQNGDGSWSGHHCITGRTFCTSTALLTLLTDRTPVPVQAKEKDQDKDGAKAAPKTGS